MAELYTIKQAAVKLGIPLNTLNHYRRTKPGFPEAKSGGGKGNSKAWTEKQVGEVWTVLLNMGYFCNPSKTSQEARRAREKKYG